MTLDTIGRHRYERSSYHNERIRKLVDWAEKVDELLNRACQAEANLDYVQAERLFELALLCEALLRPEVTDPKAYVCSTGLVYFWVGCRGPITADQLIAI